MEKKLLSLQYERYRHKEKSIGPCSTSIIILIYTSGYYYRPGPPFIDQLSYTDPSAEYCIRSITITLYPFYGLSVTNWSD